MATSTQLNEAARRIIEVVASTAPRASSPSAAIDGAALEDDDSLSPRGLVQDLERQRYLVTPGPGLITVGPRGWMWIDSDSGFSASARSVAATVFRDARALVNAIVRIADDEVERDLAMDRFSSAAGLDPELATEAWTLLLEGAAPLLLAPKAGSIRVLAAAMDRGRLEQALMRRGAPPWRVVDDVVVDDAAAARAVGRTGSMSRSRSEFQPFTAPTPGPWWFSSRSRCASSRGPAHGLRRRVPTGVRRRATPSARASRR